MTTQAIPQSTRWTEITTIWKDNRWLYVIAGVLLGILVTPAIEQITGNLNDLVGNLVPEAIGIIFTVLILDRLAANRSKEELKTRLLNEVKSPAAGIAVNALDWLRREKWIDDDTFKGQSMINVNWERAYVGDLNLEGAMLNMANLQNTLTTVVRGNQRQNYPINMSKASLVDANLTGALLGGANLSEADMRSVNLNESFLKFANLENANLFKADIQQANLMESNFRYANMGRVKLQYTHLGQSNLYKADLTNANLNPTDLRKTNLQAANFSFANLQGANLQNAALQNANLANTIFDEHTILPDAHMGSHDENGNPTYTKYWTPDTDMRRYTDPNHPDFWQPNYLKRDYDKDRPAWVTDDMLTD